MKKKHAILLLPALMLAACDDSRFNGPDSDSAGSATFVISTQPAFGIEVTSRAGEETAETSGSIEAYAAPEGMNNLEYILTDGEGRVINHHYARLEEDFSRLTLEGLNCGQYSIMFLASGPDAGNASTTEPSSPAEPWVLNTNETAPVNSLHYHKKIDFAIGFGQAPVREQVELDLAVARVDVVLGMNNLSLWRNVKSVTLTVDGEVHTHLKADGTYGGSAALDSIALDCSNSLMSFTTFPSDGPVSGTVEVVSELDNGTEFTNRYNFSDLSLQQGKVSRVVVPYRHPEASSGRLYVLEKELSRFETDTMFMSDEPRDVFYNAAQRSFYTKTPLQLTIGEGGALSVKYYSPIGLRDVRVLARLRSLGSEYTDDEWFDLAYFEAIPAFLEGQFKMPLVERECTFTTPGGRVIRVPAQPSLTAADIELKFEAESEFLDKIDQIDSNVYVSFWKFGADSGHATWKHMSPDLCRHAVALAYNMGYMFSSPEFEEELQKYEGVLVGNDGTTVIDLNTIRTKLRNYKKFRFGKAQGGGYAGLGAADGTYGLADYCYTGVYHDKTAVGSNPHNYARQAMFHEFGHCLGYNHSSNMTYGNKWTVLCATVFVQLGREGKLPVSNSTDVTDLPYWR